LERKKPRLVLVLLLVLVLEMTGKVEDEDEDENEPFPRLYPLPITPVVAAGGSRFDQAQGSESVEEEAGALPK